MRKEILATASLFLAFSASGYSETLKGTVSDSMCAAKHVNATKEDIECAQKCVKGGSPAVLIVGDKVYTIENQDAVASHIGHKVTVTGKLTGDTIHIDGVKM